MQNRRVVVTEAVQLDQNVVHGVEVKVGGGKVGIEVVSRVLHGGELVDFVFLRHDNHAAGVLPRRLFHALAARRQTLLLRVADLQSALLEVLRHIAICRFFRQARAENVVMPEQLLDVMERAVLIFAGEVQVNIRHLVALKAEEHLERDVEAVLHELLTADWAVLVRQVNADFVLALVHVEKALAAMGAAVMRRKRVDLRDAAHTRNEARTDRTAAADKIPVRVGLADQPLGNVVQRREAIADDGF